MSFAKSTDDENDKYQDLTDLAEEEMLDVVPTGKCMNCGGECYRGRSLCSDDCETSYMAYINSGLL